MKIYPLLVLIALVSPGWALEFKQGDRVVLLGNTFIEREGNYGHIETRLAAGHEGKDMIFRNLGWSGDNVYGAARSYFGPPQEGLNRLKVHLEFLKPTVVIVCYGAVAAFEGDSGMDDFISGYARLLDMIKAVSKPRMVLVSPPPCETLLPPLPDMVPQNRRLAAYRDRIRELARSRGEDFADLFGAMNEGKTQWRPAVTLNGVHFSENGYRRIAPIVAGLLGVRKLQLQESDYEGLRKLVVEKNRLFFNRWRPQNETYLHGFRKHEQGRNAKEIFEFDPLVAEKDLQIHQMAKKATKQ